MVILGTTYVRAKCSKGPWPKLVGSQMYLIRHIFRHSSFQVASITIIIFYVLVNIDTRADWEFIRKSNMIENLPSIALEFCL